MDSGEWTEYTINVLTTGTYNIQTQVAASGAGGTFHIEFNGVNKTGTITIPNTGGWQTWTTVSIPNVSLSSGQQIMKIVSDANNSSTGIIGNIDWVKINASSSP